MFWSLEDESTTADHHFVFANAAHKVTLADGFLLLITPIFIQHPRAGGRIGGQEYVACYEGSKSALYPLAV